LGVGLSHYNNYTVDFDVVAENDFSSPATFDFTIDPHSAVLYQLLGFPTAVDDLRPFEQRRKLNGFGPDRYVSFGGHEHNKRTAPFPVRLFVAFSPSAYPYTRTGARTYT
jgi:hypothetical protein